MSWKEDLETWVDGHLDTAFEVRDGTVVPSTDSVTNKQAVKLDAAFLYADLAGSSDLARHCPWDTTAKIIRAFLDVSSRLIRAYKGEIRSFDGDRVMGVFVGDTPRRNATKCAREIFYTVENILAPKATKKFKSISDNNIKLKCGIGVDHGTSRAVRAGIRNSNDLIWIGRPPNMAAKLSDIREYPYSVMIHKDVYSVLEDADKYVNGVDIWESRTYTLSGVVHSIYRTKFTKLP
ncbi:adenylate/guanylate cyclase domain-containing protein (plasmid) [Agrobacterium sp. rho-13.3]|uniref:adenylate/guanylate cyclase domain-containing protein n=1 Tax=Agrobacterium sp. rho-13.3 TaxID=3072980 RepID=UPI000DDC8DB3|nr:adenylate/guanylate cyclase domain-containing protein [Agrobacterium sp. rho-13.3]MDX8310311.1 adenylate/guanylate cyclase domain-containing protein [Agrobacterium sp. rho-13.3]